jgi:hypothetical protein
MQFLILSNIFITFSNIIGNYWLVFSISGCFFGLYSFIFPSSPFGCVRLTNYAFEWYSFFFLKTKQFRSLEDLKRDAKLVSIDCQALESHFVEIEDKLKDGGQANILLSAWQEITLMSEIYAKLATSPTYYSFFFVYLVALPILGSCLTFYDSFMVYTELIEQNYLLLTDTLPSLVDNVYESRKVLEFHIATFLELEPDSNSTLLTEEDKASIQAEVNSFNSENNNNENNEITLHNFLDKEDNFKNKFETEKQIEKETTAPLGWVVVTGIFFGCLYMLSYAIKY